MSILCRLHPIGRKKGLFAAGSYVQIGAETDYKHSLLGDQGDLALPSGQYPRQAECLMLCYVAGGYGMELCAGSLLVRATASGPRPVTKRVTASRQWNRPGGALTTLRSNCTRNATAGRLRLGTLTILSTLPS